MKTFFCNYIADFRKEIAAILLCSLFCSLLTVGCSGIMNRIVEETLGSAQDGDGTLFFSLAALFFMACIWVIFIYLEKMLSGRLGLQISRRIRQDVTEKLMRLRYDFFMEQEAGGFLTRLNDDVRDAADYLEKLLSTVLSNGIVILILSVYLCTVNRILFLFSILWIPIVTLIFRSFLKSIAALSRERKQQQDRLTGLIREAFACTETEKSFLLQERNLKKLNDSVNDILSVDLMQQKKEAFLTPFSFVTQALPTLSCCLFAAFLSFLGYVQVQELISFRRVSFSYPHSAPVLKQISFEIQKGERVAFVGSSGGGKSTLIMLILGLYPVRDGTYLLYGNSFSALDLKEVRKCFSIVAQEPFLFPDTIAENLRYGNPDASMEEIRAAMRAVGLDDYVCGLPDGYETLLEEGGTNLSGGQKQRLSIARALLRKSEIVLMDEPTSALDAESETEIVRLADTVLQGKTILTIAHKLNTIRNYDRIYVLDRGTIAECGSHEELMAAGGLYYRLYTGSRETGSRERKGGDRN